MENQMYINVLFIQNSEVFQCSTFEWIFTELLADLLSSSDILANIVNR